MKNVDKIDSTMMNRRFEYRENPENNSLVIDDIHFQTVCEIKLDHDEAGKILISRPQAKYKKASSAKLHRYGNGEFCRFRIPKIWNVSGVYAIIVDSRLTYIGECEDLSFRFNTGYGQISPRNCYIGGQQTNCRINKLILEAAIASSIKLYFYPTSNHITIESRLLCHNTKPDWNR